MPKHCPSTPKHNVDEFNRYLFLAGEAESSVPGTLEGTIGSDEEPAPVDTGHRNYDETMEEHTREHSLLGLDETRARLQTALGESLGM